MNLQEFCFGSVLTFLSALSPLFFLSNEAIQLPEVQQVFLTVIDLPYKNPRKQ